MPSPKHPASAARARTTYGARATPVSNALERTPRNPTPAPLAHSSAAATVLRPPSRLGFSTAASTPFDRVAHGSAWRNWRDDNTAPRARTASTTSSSVSSSAMGTPVCRTNASNSSAWFEPATRGSSTYCSLAPPSRTSSPNVRASSALNPRFASHRKTTSGPTAARTAHTAAASAFAPPARRATLSLRHRKPCATSACASAAASSGVPLPATRLLTRTSPPASATSSSSPSARDNGTFAAWAVA